MSDRRHRKQPPTLPEGFQHGDAKHVPCATCIKMVAGACRRFGCMEERWRSAAFDLSPDRIDWFGMPEGGWPTREDIQQGQTGKMISIDCVTLDDKWRAPHENAAAQLARQSRLSCPDLEERTGEETV